MMETVKTSGCQGLRKRDGTQGVFRAVKPLCMTLVQEDPLEEGTVTHSSVLAWGIPWTEEPGGLQPIRVAKSQT